MQSIFLLVGFFLLTFGIFSSKTYSIFTKQSSIEIYFIIFLILFTLLILKSIFKKTHIFVISFYILLSLSIYTKDINEIVYFILILLSSFSISSFLYKNEFSVLPFLICSIALLTSFFSWTIPFPIHYQLVWISILTIIIITRTKKTIHFVKIISNELKNDVLGINNLSLFLISTIFIFSSLSAYLPRIYSDDLSYHLLLPFDLLNYKKSRLDIATQAFTLSPWGGDILHSLLMVLTNKETSLLFNIFWLFITSWSIFKLSLYLNLSKNLSSLTTCLFISIPYTSYLTGAMNTESITPGIIVTMYLVVRFLKFNSLKDYIVFCIISGFFLSMKISNLLIFAPIFILFIFYNYSKKYFLKRLILIFPIFLYQCGSSYFYSYLISGNPFFPMLNNIFKSEYFRLENYNNPIWNLPIKWNLIWDITFNTNNYLSSYPGAFGILLIAFIGSIPFILLDKESRIIFIVALSSFILVFYQVQYLRYVFPIIALLTPVLISNLKNNKFISYYLIIAIFLQILLIPSASWSFNNSYFKKFFLSPDDDFLKSFLVEKNLVNYFNNISSNSDILLLTDRSKPFLALSPGKIISPSWYDHKLSSYFNKFEEEDNKEERWEQLIIKSGANYILVNESNFDYDLNLALKKFKAVKVKRIKDITLYKLDTFIEYNNINFEKRNLIITSEKFNKKFIQGKARVILNCSNPSEAIHINWVFQLLNKNKLSLNYWSKCSSLNNVISDITFNVATEVNKVYLKVKPVKEIDSSSELSIASAFLDVRNDLISEREYIFENKLFIDNLFFRKYDSINRIMNKNEF